jgi:hypothetical protein
MSKEKRNINFSRKIELYSQVVLPPETKGPPFVTGGNHPGLKGENSPSGHPARNAPFVTGREATRDKRGGAFSLGSYYDPRLKGLLSWLVIRPVTKGGGSI